MTVFAATINWAADIQGDGLFVHWRLVAPAFLISRVLLILLLFYSTFAFSRFGPRKNTWGRHHTVVYKSGLTALDERPPFRYTPNRPLTISLQDQNVHSVISMSESAKVPSFLSLVPTWQRPLLDLTDDHFVLRRRSTVSSVSSVSSILSTTSSDYGENGYLVLTAMTSFDASDQVAPFEDD